MRRAPRSPDQSLLTADLIRRIVLVSIVLVAAAFLMFEGLLDVGAPVAEARTAAINVFVVVQIANLISCRSLDRLRLGGWNHWLVSGIGLMAVLQALITYVPVLNTLFLAFGALALIVAACGTPPRWDVEGRTESNPCSLEQRLRERRVHVDHVGQILQRRPQPNRQGRLADQVCR